MKDELSIKKFDPDDNDETEDDSTTWTIDEEDDADIDSQPEWEIDDDDAEIIDNLP